MAFSHGNTFFYTISFKKQNQLKSITEETREILKRKNENLDIEKAILSEVEKLFIELVGEIYIRIVKIIDNEM